MSEPDEDELKKANEAAHRDYSVDGHLLWDVMVTLLTFDEFLRNRGHQLAHQEGGTYLTNAMLHIAQNRIIVSGTLEKLERILHSQVTEAEKQRLTDYMKRIKRDDT